MAGGGLHHISNVGGVMSSATFRNNLDSDDEPDPVPRVRKYLAGQREEWVVFFRPKDKPLHAMRISENLWKHYLGVTNVTKMNKNKLRVVVNNRTEANQIVCDPRFCNEYRVWIPARSVEIDGVVSEDGLTAQQIWKGVGQFKRKNLPAVQIIDVQQMAKSEGEGTNKRFTPSSSFRVTFAGTALPDFLLIDGVLLLPVRMYHPRIMRCTNCQRLGHTKAFCYNKTVCGKCGEKHSDEACHKEVVKCLLCGGDPHEARVCPKYRERSEQLKLDLKKRSKRSFAEIVKAATATTRTDNPFDVLQEDKPEPQQPEEGEKLIQGTSKSRAPKRKKASSSKPTKSKPSECALESNEFDRSFPPLVVTNPEVAKAPGDQAEPLKVRIPFSVLARMVLAELSEPVRAIVEPLVPFLRELGKQFSETSTLLEFICFDK